MNIFTGKYNQMDLPVTHEQLAEWLGTRKLVQHVFTNLTATQLEFLISGMNPEEQAKFYNEKTGRS